MAAMLGWTAAFLGGACGAIAAAGVFAWLRIDRPETAGWRHPGVGSKPLLAVASFFWLIVDASLVLMPGAAMPLPSLLFVAAGSLATWAYAIARFKPDAAPEPQ